MAEASEATNTASISVPSAENLRKILSSARQRNGLPLTEKTLKDNIKWLRTLYRRGIMEPDVLHSEDKLKAVLWENFPSHTNRCIYARCLQTYLACCNSTEMFADLNARETIALLQTLIKESNLAARTS
jgi:hypothetical protein